jgi:hypothetical protein
MVAMLASAASAGLAMPAASWCRISMMTGSVRAAVAEHCVHGILLASWCADCEAGFTWPEDDYRSGRVILWVGAAGCLWAIIIAALLVAWRWR